MKTSIFIRIFLWLIIPFFVILSIPMIYVIIHMGISNNNVVNNIKTNLINEETQTLLFRSSDRTNLTTRIFEASINNIILAGNYGNDLYSNKIKISSYIIYNGENPSINSPPGGMIQDPYHPRKYNLNSLGYFLLTGSPKTDKISNMLNIFRQIYLSNIEYDSIYMGTEDGLFITYPYTDKTHFRTLKYKSFPDNNNIIGYDPRLRIWYYQAIFNTFNDNKVKFTTVYKDASTGNLLITASIAIFNETQRIGVIGIDLPLLNLEKHILKSKILENGYTYLMDNEMNAVIYPNLDYSTGKNTQIIDLETNNDDDKNKFKIVLNEIVKKKEGDTIFIKNNEKWKILYNSVKNTDYSVIMQVPINDIEKPANDMAKNTIITITILIVIFIIVYIIIMIIIGLSCIPYNWFLKKNIDDFIKVLNNIKSGNLNVELDDVPIISSELENIKNNIKNLIIIVRCGNDEYNKGNLNKALTNYQKALKIMKKSNNERGIGVCLNNIGNVNIQQNNLTEAKKYYELSINNIQKKINNIEKQLK